MYRTTVNEFRTAVNKFKRWHILAKECITIAILKTTSAVPTFEDWSRNSIAAD